MATITATPDTVNSPPRFALAVAGASGSTVTITRTDPDGGIRPVRLASPATLVAGAWTGYDYESPWDALGGASTVTYTAVATTTFSTTVGALEVARPWLVHPGVPDLSQPLTLLYLDPGETMPSGGTAHNVLGRETPVIVTDGIRKSIASQLAIATPDAATAADFDALFADTSPLLLQIPNLVDGTYAWIFIGDIVRDRAGGVLGDAWRRWTLPFTVVDLPAGGVAAQRNWSDLMAEASTWNAVLGFYHTWTGVISGTHGT